MVTASRVKQFNIPLSLTIIFLLLFCAISLIALLSYNQQKKTIIINKQGELLTLAAFKVSEIREWREQHIADAQLILDNLYFLARLREWLNHGSPAGHRQELLSWMFNRSNRLDYKDIYLLDAKGAVRLPTEKEREPLAPRLKALVDEALRTKKVVFSDLYTTDASRHILLDFLVPLLIPDAADSLPVGVLLFRIDPDAILFPLLQSSPVRSDTGETLLVRREGENVLFLNELRHRKNTALSLKVPLSERSLPAVRAALGQEGAFEGIDYRGAAVLAAVKAVPNSPWFLVAKIDEAEVLGPARKLVWFISILVMALVAAAGVSIMFFIRQQQMDAGRRQYALELERRSISQQYEYLKKYANDIILLFDAQGTLLEVNDSALAAYGYSREELLKMPVSQLRAPETRSALETDIRKITEQGGLVFETLHQRKDATIFPVEISSRMIAVAGKNLYQSIIRDITDRKQAEQSLRESQEQFRAVMEKANDAVFFVDSTGSIRFWNRMAEKIYGYPADEVLGQPFSVIVPKQFQAAHRQWLEEFLAAGESNAPQSAVEGIGERKDGTVFFVETSTGIVKRGNEQFLIAIVRDITGRKKADAEIQRKDSLLTGVARATGVLLSQREVESAVAAALETIGHEVGVDRVYLFKNHDDPQTGERLMSQLYEWAHETVTPQINNPGLQDLSYTHFPGWYETMAGGAPVKGLTRDFADTIRAILEPEDILSILLVPIIIADTFWGFIGFDDCKQERSWSDSELSILATLAGGIGNAIKRHQAEQEQERLQVQLYQSQKMEAVGHLAGGIAHDFNNILTAIMGYGSLLQAKLKENDPLRNHVDQILTSAERAAALVRSLLAYSRKQIINPKPVKINEIVVIVENMLHRIIGEDITLQTMLSEHDNTVVADAGQIEQLLINLATNARDAMPAGGLLTIMTGQAEMDAQFIKAHGYGTPGTYVLLTVSDTGSGMDAKTQRQIFEPFFTTKEVGKGTGLGLSTVYGIVKQHNGFINCYSETGRGTTFKIYLPLVKSPSDPAVQPSAIPRPPVLQGGSETILLAEDDDDLRKLIRQVLEDFGYTVLAAADGDAALELFTEHHDDINLLLLDVIMPKKNGREAYTEMRKIEPAIKALFTSGYTADIIHKQGLLEQGLEFILKPVSPTELLKKVREVLDK